MANGANGSGAQLDAVQAALDAGLGIAANAVPMARADRDKVVDLLGDPVDVLRPLRAEFGAKRFALWKARKVLEQEGADPLAMQWYLVCEAVGRGDTDEAARRNAELLPYFYPRLGAAALAGGRGQGRSSVTFTWDDGAGDDVLDADGGAP